MNKTRAELELLLLELREKIGEIKQFAAENDLEPPAELEFYEHKYDRYAAQVVEVHAGA